MQEILKILERDARVTPEQIAVQTGLSLDEVTLRLREWERAGVIRRYKTVVDWERLGEQRVYAFIDVQVTPARGVGFDDVAERIYRFPEVRSVMLISGTHDLRCIVEGRTMQEVGDFVAQKLATIERVHGTATHFLLKKYKDDGEIFAESEEDNRLLVTP